MGPDLPTILYKRSRFLTRLPVDRRYTASHYWLIEETAEVWRVGLTKFATRMLGELVEYEFSVNTGDAIDIGQKLGWLEGFKAVTSVYSAVQGEFLGAGDGLRSDITAMDSDPYGAGWLYRARGKPEAASVDVHGYIAILDATIDKLLESRHTPGDADGAS